MKIVRLVTDFRLEYRWERKANKDPKRERRIQTSGRSLKAVAKTAYYETMLGRNRIR